MTSGCKLGVVNKFSVFTRLRMQSIRIVQDISFYSMQNGFVADVLVHCLYAFRHFSGKINHLQRQSESQGRDLKKVSRLWISF